jgi:hypothetical protein
MKPAPFELKELIRQDLRVRAYKSNQWQEFCKDYTILGMPPILLISFTMILACIFAIAILYISSIIVVK